MEDNAIVPVDLEISIVDDVNSSVLPNLKKIDSADFASLGLSADLLQQIQQFNATPGGEGIYKVTFKNGFNGQLSKFKNENAYLGSGISNGQMAQARLTQIPFDPSKLFMGLMLIDLQRKANQILALEQEILDAVYDIEESKYKGYVKELSHIIDDYKNNWQLQSFIQQKLSVIGTIKADSESGRSFYQKSIERIINSPIVPEFIAVANKKVNKLHSFIDGYRLTFYDLVMSTYIETLLMRNFEEENLQTIKDRLKEICREYDSLLQRCKIWEEKYLSSSIGHVVIAPVLNGLDNVVGKAVEKLTPWEFEKFYLNYSPRCGANR
ncbi:MAG: hypothetical protein ACI4W2_00825 [Eubacterium sp.]